MGRTEHELLGPDDPEGPCESNQRTGGQCSASAESLSPVACPPERDCKSGHTESDLGDYEALAGSEKPRLVDLGFHEPHFPCRREEDVQHQKSGRTDDA